MAYSRYFTGILSTWPSVFLFVATECKRRA